MRACSEITRHRIGEGAQTSLHTHVEPRSTLERRQFVYYCRLGYCCAGGTYDRWRPFHRLLLQCRSHGSKTTTRNGSRAKYCLTEDNRTCIWNTSASRQLIIFLGVLVRMQGSFNKPAIQDGVSRKGVVSSLLVLCSTTFIVRQQQPALRYRKSRGEGHPAANDITSGRNHQGRVHNYGRVYNASREDRLSTRKEAHRAVRRWLCVWEERCGVIGDEFGANRLNIFQQLRGG